MENHCGAFLMMMMVSVMVMMVVMPLPGGFSATVAVGVVAGLSG